ncbi:MAG: polymer-forming cytoskeletal protein [Hyphomicrobiaceae bacterium]|nr:polymer-forming cytoskeletal protein [Hyphomicrobiaceae bacterium]
MTQPRVADTEWTVPALGYPPAPEGQVLYAVGDIHGRLDLLEHVLEAIDRDKAQTRELRQREGRASRPLPFRTYLPKDGEPGAAGAPPPLAIGPDITVRGRIQADGTLLIDGRVSGDVHASRIVVGPEASVEGALIATDILISGSVEGTVRGHSLKFESGAQVKADVLHRSLVVEEGCHFEGRALQLEDPLSDRHNGTLLALGEPDVEIFLGDYIDRGDNSRGVVEVLAERARKVRAVFLRGNHEQFLLDFLAGTLDFAAWKQVGALSTLLSYGIQAPELLLTKPQKTLRAALDDALSGTHARFYADTVPYFVAGPYLFVHAGLRPGVPLAQQRHEDLLGIRKPFLEFEGSFEHTVVHGHTPVRAPEFKRNRINLDTGAYSSGRLTCLRIGAEGPRLLEV